MKYRRLNSLNDSELLPALEAGKSKIKVTANVVPGRAALGLQMTSFWLCLPMEDIERKRIVWYLFLEELSIRLGCHPLTFNLVISYGSYLQI